MTPKSIVENMFSLQQAIENCERSGNTEWLAKHRASLRSLAKLLPSGSGIDNGTNLERIRTTPGAELIELTCGYHHHGEQGYEGWTTHTIRVRPSFVGLNITISGPDRNEVKDYLHGVYSTALTELVHYLDGRWVSVDVQLQAGTAP